MSLYLYICTDGEELSTSHQESDLKDLDPEEEHQEQNCQHMGRNVTATKHCQESIQTGVRCRKTATGGQ